MAITLYVSPQYIAEESAYLANAPATALELSGAKLGQRRNATIRLAVGDSVVILDQTIARLAAQDRKQIEERILVPGSTFTYELSGVRLLSIVRHPLGLDTATILGQTQQRVAPSAVRANIADSVLVPEGLVSVRLSLRFEAPLPDPDVTTLIFEDGSVFAFEDGTILDLTV